MEGFIIRGWGRTLPGGPANPSQQAISQWGWGFHTMRDGIDPGDHRFRPRFDGVVDVWKNL